MVPGTMEKGSKVLVLRDNAERRAVESNPDTGEDKDEKGEDGEGNEREV